jgi:hypothetical protein
MIASGGTGRTSCWQESEPERSYARLAGTKSERVPRACKPDKVQAVAITDALKTATRTVGTDVSSQRYCIEISQYMFVPRRASGFESLSIFRQRLRFKLNRAATFTRRFELPCFIFLVLASLFAGVCLSHVTPRFRPPKPNEHIGGLRRSISAVTSSDWQEAL